MSADATGHESSRHVEQRRNAHAGDEHGSIPAESLMQHLGRNVHNARNGARQEVAQKRVEQQRPRAEIVGRALPLHCHDAPLTQ